MMRNLIYIMLLLSVMACDRMESPDKPADTEKTLPVKVDIRIEAENGSKAVNDPARITSPAEVIKNLWIIQFNGTTDDSRVLGEPAYISDFSTWDKTVPLVETNSPCAIYFIANTFERNGEFPVGQWTNLGDLKNLKRLVNCEEDILGSETEELKHVIMQGHIIPQKIDGTVANLTACLKRNIAKVTFTISNNAPANEEVVIRSIQICSVPSISHYTSDCSEVETIFPAQSDFSKTNYSEVAWPEGKTTFEKTFYIPVNKRGTTASQSQSTKNELAPDGSTYLLITATHGEEEYPLTYTFFLGADLIKDHNIEANKSYSYRFDINSKGDADSDGRITDWGLVDFTNEEKYPLSNCYILNPMPSGTGHRNFRIPIKRVTEFWGDGSVNRYENNYNYSLRDNGGWRCYVLASDFPIDGSNFRIVKGSGNSGTDTYFEVSVAAGVKGNVMIAICHTKDNQSLPCWSWHLWITEYDPYPALKWGNGTTGQYIYPVQNGSMHRYHGTYWNSNKDHYIMDRNIGALSSDTYPSDNLGLLYYQYGRKDPFFASEKMYYYSSNYQTYSAKEYSEANGTGNEINAVAYSVRNPLFFIKGATSASSSYESWTHLVKYTNPSFIWNDPETASGGSKVGKKSIFDPCPSGYRLPDESIWSDWKEQGVKHDDGVYEYQDKPTTNVFGSNKGTINANDPLLRGFKSYLVVKGEQYWPYGNGENIPQQVIYYPASGYLMQTSGNIDNHGNSDQEYWAFVWTEDSHATNEGLGLAHATQTNNLSRSTGHRKSRGLPVRCITDRK